MRPCGGDLTPVTVARYATTRRCSPPHSVRPSPSRRRRRRPTSTRHRAHIRPTRRRSKITGPGDEHHRCQPGRHRRVQLRHREHPHGRDLNASGSRPFSSSRRQPHARGHHQRQRDEPRPTYMRVREPRRPRRRGRRRRTAGGRRARGRRRRVHTTRRRWRRRLRRRRGSRRRSIRGGAAAPPARPTAISTRRSGRQRRRRRRVHRAGRRGRRRIALFGRTVTITSGGQVHADGGGGAFGAFGASGGGSGGHILVVAGVSTTRGQLTARGGEGGAGGCLRRRRRRRRRPGRLPRTRRSRRRELPTSPAARPAPGRALPLLQPRLQPGRQGRADGVVSQTVGTRVDQLRRLDHGARAIFGDSDGPLTESLRRPGRAASPARARHGGAILNQCKHVRRERPELAELLAFNTGVTYTPAQGAAPARRRSRSTSRSARPRSTPARAAAARRR